jgi:hypothetical protein
MEATQMTINERGVLQDLVNGLENLAVSVDSLEAILIRKGLLKIGEIEQQAPNHVLIVAGKLATLRSAIASL